MKDLTQLSLSWNRFTSLTVTYGLRISCVIGPNVLSRISRDVLAQLGVRYAMIWEGVNDIDAANPGPASQREIGGGLIAALQQILSRIHTFGIHVLGPTISPFGTPPGSDKNRHTRTQSMRRLGRA